MLLDVLELEVLRPCGVHGCELYVYLAYCLDKSRVYLRRAMPDSNRIKRARFKTFQGE